MRLSAFLQTVSVTDWFQRGAAPPAMCTVAVDPRIGLHACVGFLMRSSYVPEQDLSCSILLTDGGGEELKMRTLQDLSADILPPISHPPPNK